MRLNLAGGILAAVILVALVAAYGSLFTVYQTDQVLVVRLGVLLLLRVRVRRLRVAALLAVARRRLTVRVGLRLTVRVGLRRRRTLPARQKAKAAAPPT